MSALLRQQLGTSCMRTGSFPDGARKKTKPVLTFRHAINMSVCLRHLIVFALKIDQLITKTSGIQIFSSEDEPVNRH